MRSGGYHAPVAPQRDAALAAGLQARDEDALREVVTLYGPAVHGMALRVLTDATLAEEVVQDTFLALWRRPGSYDPARGASLKAFLSGVARNKAVDLVRREESRRRVKDSLLSDAEAGTGATMSPADEIGDRIAVQGALQQLSAPQREAVVLAYFGGRTYREVAKELGIPEGTAKTRLRDGLGKLRHLLRHAERR